MGQDARRHRLEIRRGHHIAGTETDSGVKKVRLPSRRGDLGAPGFNASRAAYFGNSTCPGSRS